MEALLPGMLLLQRKRGEKYGTSGDNESVHYHAHQYDNRVCGTDGVECDDSFDPYC